MKKRIISATLAAIMAVSAFATTAFAADVDLKGNSSIALKATTLIPTLKVTLPKTLAFVVNPYAMEIDKTTGKAWVAKKNAEGEVTNSGDKATTTIVPTYGTTTNADKTVTANTAWQVKNDSGVALTAALYAKAVNASPAIKVGDENVVMLQILDGKDETPKDIDGTTAAAATKKQLTLALKATPVNDAGESGTAVSVPIRDAAPASWAADTVAKVTKIPSSGTLDLTLDTTKSTAKKGADCTEAWTAKDTATLNVVFNFDFWGAAD